LNGAASPVEQSAAVALRPREARRLRGIDEVDRSAPLTPLAHALGQRSKGRFRGGELQPAVANGLAVDAEAVDQIEYQIRSTGDHRHQFLSHPSAEHMLEGVRVVLETGDDLPAIAARSALAHRLAVEHDHRASRLAQMQGRRQAGVAGADHRHLGADASAQRLAVHVGRRRRRPHGLRRLRCLRHRG
jgi:hypothetical protein